MTEKRNYAMLNQVSTEALEEMLRAEIETAGDHDDEFVLHILEVIEKRESENPTGRLGDVDRAWEVFRTYYQTPEGAGQALYPTELPGEGERNTILRKRRPIRRMLKRLPHSAALIAVVLSVILVAQAAGFDVCGVIARWTDETFHFETAGSIQNRYMLKNEERSNMIKNTLKECGMSPALAPSWFPEEFVMSEPQVFQSERIQTILYTFQDYNDHNYSITFDHYYSPNSIEDAIFEKDSGPVEKRSNGLQTFYIMSNLDTWTAAWTDGQTCVSIFGNIPVDDIKKIIDSMGGNEI